MIKYLNDNDNFYEEIKQKVVIVDFYASWCGPCRMLNPILEEVDKELDDIKILKVDVDEIRDISKKFGILSIPTLIVFKDGIVVEKKVGFSSKEDILKLVDK
ncbi:MAG: thioredoxin [Bacilli bacterium]|nr:thioredoxin [Bacilli bacterium]